MKLNKFVQNFFFRMVQSLDHSKKTASVFYFFLGRHFRGQNWESMAGYLIGRWGLIIKQ